MIILFLVNKVIIKLDSFNLHDLELIDSLFSLLIHFDVLFLVLTAVVVWTETLVVVAIISLLEKFIFFFMVMVNVFVVVTIVYISSVEGSKGFMLMF